jgi:hypothetical protein
MERIEADLLAPGNGEPVRDGVVVWEGRRSPTRAGRRRPRPHRRPAPGRRPCCRAVGLPRALAGPALSGPGPPGPRSGLLAEGYDPTSSPWTATRWQTSPSWPTPRTSSACGRPATDSRAHPRPDKALLEDISESGWVRDVEISAPMRQWSQHVAEIALIPAVRGEGMQHWSARPRLLLRRYRSTLRHEPLSCLGPLGQTAWYGPPCCTTTSRGCTSWAMRAARSAV